jgi:hypothetical protein
MGLSDKKQTTTQTQQSQQANTYGYMTPGSTPDIDALRSQKFSVDPGLHAQYGNLRGQVDKAAHDPMGAAYDPHVAQQQREAARERLGQQESQAYRAGEYDVNRLNFSRNATVAGMTAPQLVQTGQSSTGSGTGTTVQSQSPWGTIAAIGAQTAMAAPSM